MSADELRGTALRHRISARIARRMGLADWAEDHTRLYRRAMERLRALDKRRDR